MEVSPEDQTKAELAAIKTQLRTVSSALDGLGVALPDDEEDDGPPRSDPVLGDAPFRLNRMPCTASRCSSTKAAPPSACAAAGTSLHRSPPCRYTRLPWSRSYFHRDRHSRLDLFSVVVAFMRLLFAFCTLHFYCSICWPLHRASTLAILGLRGSLAVLPVWRMPRPGH